MKYSEYLKINETFQYSINLQFDINNINKIKEYIPTTDSCEILEHYFDSIFGNFNKSTILVGPYGKGKSHLLLVLLTLLNDYKDEDIDAIEKLLDKIKDINPNIYIKIRTIRDKKAKFMPVIINSNYNNINQAFLLALTESLEREGIDDIVINTYFDVALEIINKWKQENDKEIINKFKNCLEKKKTTLKQLEEGLKIYDEDYYNLFKDVYTCVLHGIEFNPLINTDIIKYYKDVNYKISQMGYTGMLVIFDEFSKFLEYVGNESMMRDLKVLQDFAELASRTNSKEQILFSCITHKAFNSYLKNLKDNKANAFKTVEGRFKELYFNRSMEQNFEIIEQTIKKNNKFNTYITKYLDDNKVFYNELKNEFSFCRINKVEDILFKGCYPLNPATVFAVINLSEKIAQNERTLFTFLTDDDVYSFKHYINNNKIGDLFNVDRIYDYFYNILKKENNETIKEIWIKAENAISKTTDNVEISILKVLAIIYMINDFENYSPVNSSIKLSLALDDKELNSKIDKLLDRGIIKRRKNNKLLEFSTVYNKEVLEEIKIIKQNKFNNINYSQSLEKIYDLGYVLPRRYNQNYKITRFFKEIFITEFELCNLKTFKLYFEKYQSDGLVLNLLRESKDIKEAIDNFTRINDKKVVVRIPNSIINPEVIDAVKEIESINYYKNSEKQENDILRELNIIQEEDLELIQNEIEKNFEDNNSYILFDSVTDQSSNISTIASEICERLYSESPIINNEMINKQKISSPIMKARDIVIDCIINKNKDLIKSETSAESTIYKAIVGKKNNEDIKKIIKLLENYIKQSEKDGKLSFERIYKKIKSEPYNIRDGIIPVFIALALDNYSNNAILYYKNKEIDLIGTNISKIIEDPQNYYIYVESGTQEKFEFINRLLKLFKLDYSNDQRENIRILMYNLKKWTLSLPRITRELSTTNKIVIDDAIINFKNELLKTDLNNNEFLFKSLKEIFSEENYLKLYNKIEKAKYELDNYFDNYENFVIEQFKNIFENSKDNSLNKILKKWHESLKEKIKYVVLKTETKQLLDYILEINTFNDKDIIENISYILLGYYIEDWQANSYSIFFNNFEYIIDELNTVEENSKDKIEISVKNKEGNNIIKFIDNVEISSIGKTLMSNIEETIEEYADSIDKSEKINILMNILDKYM